MSLCYSLSLSLDVAVTRRHSALCPATPAPSGSGLPPPPRHVAAAAPAPPPHSARSPSPPLRRCRSPPSPPRRTCSSGGRRDGPAWSLLLSSIAGQGGFLGQSHTRCPAGQRYFELHHMISCPYSMLSSFSAPWRLLRQQHSWASVASLEGPVPEVGKLCDGRVGEGDAPRVQEFLQLGLHHVRLSRLHLQLVHLPMLEGGKVELQQLLPIAPLELAPEILEAAEAYEAIAQPILAAAHAHELAVQGGKCTGLMREGPGQGWVHVFFNLIRSAHTV
mmetsp:Transcript_35279/g.90229  ORF Transcript_35279/g.90229 Transcript_35279/m.90229 type:complete len:276 (-) Transcript_35279:1474-2301(-)